MMTIPRIGDVGDDGWQCVWDGGEHSKYKKGDCVAVLAYSPKDPMTGRVVCPSQRIPCAKVKIGVVWHVWGRDGTYAYVVTCTDGFDYDAIESDVLAIDLDADSLERFLESTTQHQQQR